MQLQLLQQHGNEQSGSQYEGSLLFDTAPDHQLYYPSEEAPGALQWRSRSPVEGNTGVVDQNVVHSDASFNGDGSGSEGSPVVPTDLGGSTAGLVGGIGGAGSLTAAIMAEVQCEYRDQAYQAALRTILLRSDRTGGESLTWRPGVPTQKALQRQVALLLCGWSVNEEELMGAIRRWEKEGSFPRAACWLVFMKQYDKAIELLMQSNGALLTLDPDPFLVGNC